jgi:hypothetical protein
MLVALLSLFVALSGVTYAATKLDKDSVKSKHIKDSQVKTQDIKDGAVGTIDLADAAVDSAKLADGSVATGDLADNAVTNAKVADNAVGSAEVAADSLAAGDLAPSSVGTSEIIDNTIGTADIGVNGVGFSELDANSVRAFQANAGGSSVENFGSIPTNSCATTSVIVTPIDGSIIDDAIAVTAPVVFAGDFSLQAEASSGTAFLLKACNNGTTNPQDPDGASGGSYHFISFDT